MTEHTGEPAVDSFGKRIQELRRERALTQRHVAAELGIDFTYLSKLENDRGEPPGEDLVRRLAELFEVEAEELLAKAGKVPAELRERAQGDLQFATLLRTLPNLTPDQLQRVYRSAGVQAKRGKPPRS